MTRFVTNVGIICIDDGAPSSPLIASRRKCIDSRESSADGSLNAERSARSAFSYEQSPEKSAYESASSRCCSSMCCDTGRAVITTSVMLSDGATITEPRFVRLSGSASAREEASVAAAAAEPAAARRPSGARRKLRTNCMASSASASSASASASRRC